MSFIFYDVETTGISPAFDQILQFAAVRADEGLRAIDSFSIRSKLLPYVLPSPKALLVTRIAIEDLMREQVSHFEMMRAIRAKLVAWSGGGTLFAGWNSIRFDELFLRQAYYQTLQPIYQTQTNGNGRIDVMRMAQTISSLRPGALLTAKREDGLPIFRLDETARANSLTVLQAHEAHADANSTLAIARILRSNAQDLWDALIHNARTANVKRLVEDNDVLLLVETYGGQTTHRVVSPVEPNLMSSNEWAFFDLRDNPKDFIAAPDELLLSRMRGRDRTLRVVRINAQPALLSPDFIPENVEGGRLSAEEYQTRARWIRDTLSFRQRIGGLLAKRLEPDPCPSYVEERIYERFPSRLDEARLQAFHQCDWVDRKRLLTEIEDARYRQLGRRVVAVERPDLLSSDLQAEFERWRIERFQTEQSVPWRTLSKAIGELAALEIDASSDQIDQLASIRAYLKSIADLIEG